MGITPIANHLFNTAWTLGLEYNQHKRSNHLHRENVAHLLRIHEAEAYASMEYHRVAMKMANEQHEKGILQARIMHEEDMDLEKRIAVRENLRDEWTQLTERAGTVLIVNTLVLSVAFGMLIDGPLPDSITLTHQTLVVAYFCLLSSSINLLLCSVRFAMLLRFRIGKTIVSTMKEAINKSTELDKSFRDNDVYKSINTPAYSEAACDDKARKAFVQPLTAQMEKPGKDMECSDPESMEDDLAFVVGVPQGDYRNLRWLSRDTGYAARASASREAKQLYRSACRDPKHFYRTLEDAVGCRRRARRQDVSSVSQSRACGSPSSWPSNSDAVFRNMRSRFPGASDAKIMAAMAEGNYHCGHTARLLQSDTSIRDRHQIADGLANKGFTVRQLLNFYMAKKIHKGQCTEEIVRDIIVPETTGEIICYMESTFMKEHGGPQRAKTSVSHAWKMSFLNTVLNILLDASGFSKDDLRSRYLLQGCPDSGEFHAEKALHELDNDVLEKSYWLCMFAINQHENISGSCNHDANQALHETDQFEHVVALMDHHVISLDPKLESLKRLWILSEISEGVKRRPIHFRAVFDLSGQVFSKLRNGDPLVPLVADCQVSNPEEKQRIISKIDASGGQEAFYEFMLCMVELNFGILRRLPTVNGEAARQLERLEHLDMDGTWAYHISSLSDLGWSCGWGKLRNLQGLKVSFNDCDHIRDVSDVGHALIDLTSLQQLEMSFRGCMNLADVSAIGHGLKEMKTIQRFAINLECCPKLDEGLAHEFHSVTEFLNALQGKQKNGHQQLHAEGPDASPASLVFSVPASFHLPVQSSPQPRPCLTRSVSTLAGLGVDAPEYRKAVKARAAQDEYLQRSLKSIRDVHCRSWDLTAQVLFFGGTICLIIAACLLVMGRWAFRIVPLPTGADAFPPAKLAAVGFSCPCFATAVVWVIVQRKADEVSSHMNEVIGGTTASNRKLTRPTDGCQEADEEDPLNPGGVSENWKKLRHKVKVVGLWQRAAEQTDEVKTCRSIDSLSSGQHAILPLASSRSSVKSKDEIPDRLPYKATFWILASSLLNFLSFLIAALVSGRPELRLDTIKEDSAPTSAHGSAVRPTPAVLSPLPFALADGSAWPPFWEPAGASWWPSRRVLLLAGGMSLLEFHMDGTRGTQGGAWLSTPRRLQEITAPLADVCVADDGAADQSGSNTIWLASTDSRFAVFRADEAGVVGTSLPARHLFPSHGRHPGREGAVTASSIGIARATRAVACGHLRGGEEHSNPTAAQLWLAANEGPWPLVVGAEATLSGNSTAGLKWKDTLYRWPLQWLNADADIAGILSSGQRGSTTHGGIVIESIEAVPATGLFMLLTDGVVGQDKTLQQLVVAVTLTGHLRKWWMLTPPGGPAKTPAAALGVRRWIALSADSAEGRLFLVANGPQPLVSVVQLPQL